MDIYLPLLPLLDPVVHGRVLRGDVDHSTSAEVDAGTSLRPDLFLVWDIAADVGCSGIPGGTESIRILPRFCRLGRAEWHQLHLLSKPSEVHSDGYHDRHRPGVGPDGNKNFESFQRGLIL